MSCKNLTFLTLLAVILQIIGVSLFMMGFFPVKTSLCGMSGLESFYSPFADPASYNQDTSTLPAEKLKSLYRELSGVPPLFDRLIIMVIDGLPAEFVLGKDGKRPRKLFTDAMPFTQYLLARRLAIGFRAKAAPPTVTMPRLKAMVSGAIGGFLDVALNFNTHAFSDDNLIGQFLRIGWRMVMLGDETWLKLFPKVFTRHDGVSSFFVKDTVQVDYNVSRHLSNELNRTDWDLLILHYLGLDHVGHIGGRNSILMGPKLMEMDEVIRKIHLSITQTQESYQRGTLLMIVSDHGMTEGGNHGGSSFEETDSLALFVGAQIFIDAVQTSSEVHQVDIAATLALIFGVPIPKNNVGTVISEVFAPLQDKQYLRLLELNSWQLMRLLQTHMSKLGCGMFSCESGYGKEDSAERFCCSYLEATSLHESLKSNNSFRSADGDDYRTAALAYHNFLITASKWLSSRATDKPVGLLATGIAAMLFSCLGLMNLLFLLGQEVDIKERQYSWLENIKKWQVDENFSVSIIFIFVVSMGSSSMVEEEQYIWYFMTASLYLILLRKTMKSFDFSVEQKIRSYNRMYFIGLVLVSGRILRGWHQGGVNWTHLPDISKLLQQAGTIYIKSLQLVSFFLVVIVSFAAVLWQLQLKIRLAMVLVLVYLFPVLLILNQILKNQDAMITSSNIGDTTMIQNIYVILGISTLLIIVSTPWLMPHQNYKTFRDAFNLSNEASLVIQDEILLGVFKNSMFVIGWCCMYSWCLLQLLLQQPINSIPISLLLVQILASIQYFSGRDAHLKEWFKVAALYYVGMAGHYGLGNTNTLATIDVAGAFIGITSHSTVISGILMFTITYASPILALLGLLMHVSAKDIIIFSKIHDRDYGQLLKAAIGYPCLLPLGLNSILLIAYTIILLLMQNHLFVWSVFSPKYLYVCATTVCVYIGVLTVALAATYTCLAFSTRKLLEGACRKQSH